MQHHSFLNQKLNFIFGGGMFQNILNQLSIRSSVDFFLDPILPSISNVELNYSHKFRAQQTS
jgi:hypothetical protein